MTPRKLVAGNWKMHGTAADINEVVAIAAAAGAMPQVDVALCVPFTLIAPAVSVAHGLPIGAQDLHEDDKGAHTGCISGALTAEDFERELESADFEGIEIQLTHRVHEHAGSAIVRAAVPAS